MGSLQHSGSPIAFRIPYIALRSPYSAPNLEYSRWELPMQGGFAGRDPMGLLKPKPTAPAQPQHPVNFVPLGSAVTVGSPQPPPPHTHTVPPHGGADRAPGSATPGFQPQSDGSKWGRPSAPHGPLGGGWEGIVPHCPAMGTPPARRSRCHPPAL